MTWFFISVLVATGGFIIAYDLAANVEIKKLKETIKEKDSIIKNLGPSMKKLTIMRGISGSGKSTYVKKHFPDAVVCSADHFHEDEHGNYNWDPTKIGQAHDSCQYKANKAMAKGEPHVVIENTNTALKEIRPYLLMAKEHGYEVDFIRLEVPVEVASSRNVHGVPVETVEKMKNRMINIPGEKIVNGES